MSGLEWAEAADRLLRAAALSERALPWDASSRSVEVAMLGRLWRLRETRVAATEQYPTPAVVFDALDLSERVEGRREHVESVFGVHAGREAEDPEARAIALQAIYLKVEGDLEERR